MEPFWSNMFCKSGNRMALEFQLGDEISKKKKSLNKKIILAWLNFDISMSAV
jgi:hypothetical protein